MHCDLISLFHNGFVQAFEEWIQALPDINPPSWIGLPETAEQQLQNQQMQRTLTNLAVLQGVSEPLDGANSTSLLSEEDPYDEENESKAGQDSQTGGSIAGSQAILDTLQHHDAAIPTLPTLQQTMQSLQNILSSSTFATVIQKNTKVSDVLYRLLLRELQHGFDISTTLHDDLISLR
jgi:hypothetical protein